MATVARTPARRRRNGAGLRGGAAMLTVLVAWLVVAGVGGPLVGRLSEVQRNDSSLFLSENAESSRASEISARFTDDSTLPYFVVLERPGGLRDADRAAAQEWLNGLPTLEIDVEGAAGVPLADVLTDVPVALAPSEDGEALLVPVLADADVAATNLPDGQGVADGIAVTLRTSLDPLEEAGLGAYVAGPGGVAADFATAFAGIDTRLLQITLAVVFVILLLVYRSPFLPLAALVSALFALSVAGGAVYPLADAGLIDLNGQSQGILFILVVGAATDYALLLVARYREELHDEPSRYTAMRRAWRASLEPIAASASTVALGLLALLLADLGSTRGLGPVGAIGIAGAFLASLTLLPVFLLWPVVLLLLVVAGLAAGVGGLLAGGPGAGVSVVSAVAAVVILAVLRRRALRAGPDRGALPWYARPEAGRWLFWPRVPRVDHVHSADAVGTRSLWGRTAALVGRRPRRMWVLTLAGLLALAAFVPQLQADGIRQSDVFREPVESVQGTEVLGEHFPAGSGTPVLVVTPAQDLEHVLDVVAGTDGVERAVPTGAAPPAPGAPASEPLVVDGFAQVEATLAVPADSVEGEEVVSALRTALDTVTTDALVGGQTAANLDVRETSQRDLRVVVPVVLLVILVVLVLLLRSLVAPVLLVVANVVSYGATLGLAAIVFGPLVLDLPGGDPAVPLYAFVFLIALGIDYSIFLMTRVREESQVRGTRPGILVGLAVTGGVITSAGIVLAATFSALVTIPLVFMLQIAFIVAVGVLVDTFVVRTLLVPAAAYDLGARVWWPGRLGLEREEQR